jgi:hypothetical protein
VLPGRRKGEHKNPAFRQEFSFYAVIASSEKDFAIN